MSLYGIKFKEPILRGDFAYVSGFDDENNRVGRTTVSAYILKFTSPHRAEGWIASMSDGTVRGMRRDEVEIVSL